MNLLTKLGIILHCICLLLLLPYYLIKSILKSISAKPKDIRGKIVVVSGAGNGLGRGLCQRLAQLGCTVLCVDMKPEDLDETVQILRKQQGNKECAFGYVCDITDQLAVDKLRDEVISKFKKIDLLFNNAGIIYMSKFEDSTPSNIERVFNINVLGQIWMTRAFLKQMKERREGHIVFTNSIMAVLSYKESTIYSTTKSALTGFTMGLRDELNDNPEYKNIFLTVVHPAFINTNNFIKDNFSLSWPPMEVEEAASLMIDGVRKNHFEFVMPGGEFGLRILRLTRCVPWKFYVLLRTIARPKIKYDTDVEKIWHQYMTKISQKMIFKIGKSSDFNNSKSNR